MHVIILLTINVVAQTFGGRYAISANLRDSGPFKNDATVIRSVTPVVFRADDGIGIWYHQMETSCYRIGGLGTVNKELRIEAWIRLNTTTPDDGYIYSRTYYYITSNTEIVSGVFIAGNSYSLCAMTPAGDKYCSDIQLLSGEWNFVRVHFYKNEVKFFINGGETGSIQKSVPRKQLVKPIALSDVHIGCEYSNSASVSPYTNFLLGDLHDIRLYDSFLTTCSNRQFMYDDKCWGRSFGRVSGKWKPPPCELDPGEQSYFPLLLHGYMFPGGNTWFPISKSNQWTWIDTKAALSIPGSYLWCSPPTLGHTCAKVSDTVRRYPCLVQCNCSPRKSRFCTFGTNTYVPPIPAVLTATVSISSQPISTLQPDTSLPLSAVTPVPPVFNTTISVAPSITMSDVNIIKYPNESINDPPADESIISYFEGPAIIKSIEITTTGITVSLVTQYEMVDTLLYFETDISPDLVHIEANNQYRDSNSTKITLIKIGPDKSFEALRDKIIIIKYNNTITHILVITQREPTASVFGVGVASAVIVVTSVLGVSSSTASVVRLSLIGERYCRLSDIRAPLGRVLNPLNIPIAGSVYAGVIVMNIGLMSVFPLAHFVILKMTRKYCSYSRSSPITRAITRFPGSSFFAVLVLYQGTTAASWVATLSPIQIWERVLGIVSLLMCASLPIVLYRFVLSRVNKNSTYVTDDPDPRSTYPKIRNWFIGSGEWIAVDVNFHSMWGCVYCLFLPNHVRFPPIILLLSAFCISLVLSIPVSNYEECGYLHCLCALILTIVALYMLVVKPFTRMRDTHHEALQFFLQVTILLLRAVGYFERDMLSNNFKLADLIVMISSFIMIGKSVIDLICLAYLLKLNRYSRLQRKSWETNIIHEYFSDKVEGRNLHCKQMDTINDSFTSFTPVDMSFTHKHSSELPMQLDDPLLGFGKVIHKSPSSKPSQSSLHDVLQDGRNPLSPTESNYSSDPGTTCLYQFPGSSNLKPSEPSQCPTPIALNKNLTSTHLNTTEKDSPERFRIRCCLSGSMSNSFTVAISASNLLTGDPSQFGCNHSPASVDSRQSPTRLFLKSPLLASKSSSTQT